MPHVVWDWNGTLLDDLDLVIDSVNAALAEYDVEPITPDGYRNHYTRPVVLFYERLLGRPVDDDEWHRLDLEFQSAYRANLPRARLTGDAAAALASVDAIGAPQSILSMFPHEALVRAVSSLRIDSFFSRIDGLRGVRGEQKAQSLARHLEALSVEPGNCVMIGDSLDDAKAGASVGVPVVLYDGGSHHVLELHETGAPVASSLLEAIRLAGLI